MAGEIHSYRIGRQEREVDLAEPVGPLRPIKWGPTGINRGRIVGFECGTKHALDDAWGFARGVERSIGEECDGQD